MSREYSRIRAGVSAPMQGAARREYRERIAQGCNAAVARLRPLPKGAPPLACGRVASLGNGRRHSRRERALPQTKGGALMRLYSRDTTLVRAA